MNILSKIFQFIKYGNKLHPISMVRGPSRNFYIRNSSVKLLCELIAHDGRISLEGVWIDRFVRISSTKLIEIKSSTTVNMNTKIYGDVKIGSSCLIGPNVFMSSGEHMFSVYPGMTIREQENKYLKANSQLPSKPIVVGNNVWIGANTVIMPGVSIVSDVVIGANAVVVSDLDRPGVYVGQPAKIIRQLKAVD